LARYQTEQTVYDFLKQISSEKLLGIISAPVEALTLAVEDSNEILNHKDDISENAFLKKCRDASATAVLLLKANEEAGIVSNFINPDIQNLQSFVKNEATPQLLVCKKLQESF
jgi:hypothetical protein